MRLYCLLQPPLARRNYAALAEPITYTFGRVRRQEGNRIERLSPRGVAEINNPCKCFPMSAHPAFELGGRNLSSPRPGEHRGSAGFSRTAPSDPNSAAVLPRCRAVLGRGFHSRRSLGPGPRTRGSRRQGTLPLTLI